MVGSPEAYAPSVFEVVADIIAIAIAVWHLQKWHSDKLYVYMRTKEWCTDVANSISLPTLTHINHGLLRGANPSVLCFPSHNGKVGIVGSG